MTAISTIRPGLLVSVKTSMAGNITYDRRDIEAEHLTEDGTKEARWETQRTIVDPDEYEAAAKVRAKALSMIRGVCARSAFGLLCPQNSADNLARAINDAQRLVNEFNRNASLTQVSVYAIAGKIASDDVEAVRAISSEVTELMASMETGIKNLDVKMVRDAANAARSIGQMLTPSKQAEVKAVIDIARATARNIVKAGETASQEIDKAALKRIAEARTAFLDLDDTDTSVTAPAADGRAVDFGAEAEEAPAPKKIARPKLSVRPTLELE